MDEVISRKVPWHLWAVGLISLLWNMIGAYDYFQTRSGNLEYLQAAGMGEVELAWLDSFPVWANGAWALGVWGAVAGSVLLLMRSRFAVHAYVVAIFGIAVTTVFQYGFPHPASVDGALTVVFSAVLWLATLGQLYYARRQSANGLLR